MLGELFSYLNSFETFLWGYLCAPMIVALGLYFSLRTGLVQIRSFPNILRIFRAFYRAGKEKNGEIHPLKAFFACIGGCVGIGNIVAICTAVQIGGPGALFWIWVTAILGSLVKYAEVYLGLCYRIRRDEGGYDGGPMFFLKKAFKTAWIPGLVAMLLCIYGVEVYQFRVITESVTQNWQMNEYVVVGLLLGLVLYAGLGGVKRVSNIATAFVPFFVILYVTMGGIVLWAHLDSLPQVFYEVFTSAFTGAGAVGGFVGSTLMMTISQGVRRGCYTADLGVGYASVIHSTSSAKIPEHQASLALFDVLLDTFLVCTTSIMLVLTTEVWKEPLPTGMLVQSALETVFPYMNLFMPFFLFLLGYNTIITYFSVGIKCAEYLSPIWGKVVYFSYAIGALILFSFIDATQAQSLMTVAGGLLLVINTIGIFRLRKEVSFEIVAPQEEAVPIRQSELATAE